MPFEPVSALHAAVSNALVARGVGPDDAGTVADVLIQAELDGHPSHGLRRLPFVVSRLEAGLVAAKPHMTILATTSATSLLDGGNGLGPVCGKYAVDLAVKHATACGVGVVAVRNGNHLGALAYYGRRFISQGMIGLCFSNTPPAIAAPGSATAVIGTNPMCFAFPLARPVVVDMATSQAARGAILKAAAEGDSIPMGWATDERGTVTTDAQAAIAGALLPLGGPKGFALAVAVELLSGALAGSGIGSEVTGTYADSEYPSNVGHSFFALDPRAFGSHFSERGAKLASNIASVGGRMPGAALDHAPPRPDQQVEISEVTLAHLRALR